MIFKTWSSDELIMFFMVLVRMSVLVSLFPFLGDKSIPVMVKVLLSVAMSVIVYPMLISHGYIELSQAAYISSTSALLFMTIVSEVLIAAAIAFSAQLVFQTIIVAGEFMSQMMGLNSATQYDPHMESQTIIMTQILNALAMLTFLSLNGHIEFIRIVLETFQFVGIGALSFSDSFYNELLRMTGNTLAFGMQLAAPIAVILMLVNVIYGVMAKALPQLNVLTLSMAASLFVGFVVLSISYPSMSTGIAGLFNESYEDIRIFMRAISNG